MYGLHVMGYVGIALLVSAITSTTIFGEDVMGSNFIGRSSEDITKAILRSNEKNTTNYIFSPFGYSVVLGILSEGARGETRDELIKILHLPEDAGAVRRNFRSTLQRLQERSANNGPEFRNYFYVYKNFTVEEDYKTILLENYFTEVRSVDRPTYDDVQDFPTELSTTPITDFQATNIISTSTENAVTKEEKLYTAAVSAPFAQSTILHNRTQNNSAFSNNRTTENMKIKGSNHERLKRRVKRFLGVNLEQLPRIEVSNPLTNHLNSDGVARSRPRMIVFNGLYFKGYWKTPFQFKIGEETFYKNNNEKIMTKMMYAVGQFHIGQLPDLESTIVSIPYKGERYSLVIVLPNTKDGIQNMIANMHKLDLVDLHTHMKLRHLQVSVPAFEFRSTSYIKEHLKTIGVQKIFTNKADFRGLSKNSGLFVDDVVQLVTIKVDNEAGTPNFLTASSVQTRTVTEKFTADHPFVFFVQDRKDNLIITAGKLHEPTKE